MAVTTDTDTYGYQDPCMLPVISWFVVPPASLNGGISTTKIGLSSSNLYFVNSTTVWWSITLVGSDGCSDKDISIDALSTSFTLHYSVALLYHCIILYYHIILAVWCHIENWYCNNPDRHQCTMYGMLASDSAIFFSPLQSESTVSSDPHKYFLKFPMDHLTVADHPTNIYLDFSSGDTIDIEIKEIGYRCAVRSMPWAWDRC